MKKGIIWLASYPKCGNTYLRAFLSHYLEDEQKSFSFEKLNRIKKFESQSTFESILGQGRLGKNFYYYPHCLNIQKELIRILPQENLIFKTHHFYGSFDGNKFTNEENTLLFFYLVRDPREVLVSYARHSGTSIDEMLKFFVDDNLINRLQFETKVNWKLNYRSWKTFNKVPNYFIKFEDLIKNPEKIFQSIVFLLSRYTSIVYDEIKIKKIINLTKFENLKLHEKQFGFSEAKGSNFFYTGKTNSWKKILTTRQISIVEKSFRKEMTELNYL